MQVNLDVLFFCSHNVGSDRPIFSIAGNDMDFVEHWPHLGHYLSYNFDDEFDIARKTDILCGQINNILCFFNKRDVITKLRLLKSYCSSLFGSVLWDLSHARIERLCAAWRKGCRIEFGICLSMHAALYCQLYVASLPLLDTLCSRFASFIAKCFSSESFSVRNILRFGLYEGGTHSLVKRNALFCCHRFNLSFCDFIHLSPAYIKWFVANSIDPRIHDRALLVLELIFLRDNF
jgi:hypothetical protein